MSIVLTQRVAALEEKIDELVQEIKVLKQKNPASDSELSKIIGEIKALKMRMGKAG